MKIGQGKALKNKWIKKDGAGFIRAVSVVCSVRIERQLERRR
jgi:hypothetical protein